MKSLSGPALPMPPSWPHPLIQEYFPVLAKALKVLGSPLVRHMGTIGGQHNNRLPGRRYPAAPICPGCGSGASEGRFPPSFANKRFYPGTGKDLAWAGRDPDRGPDQKATGNQWPSFRKGRAEKGPGHRPGQPGGGPAHFQRWNRTVRPVWPGEAWGPR